MIERIASHVGDFTPRLQSNTRALYQYCPIPVIVFPQLENELFCNIYYLRHLCDITRFPDWPIKDPVGTAAVFVVDNVCSNSSSSSSRNEYYLGGIIALLLQDHCTMSTKSVCSSQYMVTDQH